MSRRILISIGVLAAVIGFAVRPSDAAPGDPVPTFAKDVAPILFSRCVICHRPGEIAPMSLLTYDQARPWAKAIKRKVVAREMPPWGADPKFGKFKDDPSLTPQQINTIAAWADGGAPKG